MDAILHSQFQRVEAALSTLVDSIASYNPNPQAAVDLVAADEELSKGLELLAQHQANHARILSLRHEVDSLAAQLKTSVSTLADLRHEIFDTPATTESESSRSVPINELLQYAKNISRYTVPPTYREPIPKGDSDTEKVREKDDASGGLPSNGLGTPVGPPGSMVIADPPASKDAAPEEEEKQVTAEQAEWLTKLHEAGVQWVPWPSHDKIRKGGLMVIQDMVDRGLDPHTRLLPAEQELLDRQRREAADLMKQQKEEKQREYEMRIENAKKAKAAQQAQGPETQQKEKAQEKPATFTAFDMYDEDEDMEQ
ncbi:vitamin-D-receptor interacting mediator subunit 4-domain-containing protein [Clohesyomyces aquaticus]|uniref:Mediator of RNA polymerase II transcription subunit 4 n=1 Tax=Clohesyomyces aquaticus TaxID=1231657 RepID=A0A1Y1ZQW2_9PLEO|nr:vitamin-D-receptor interacting mediator subunit 4-domain-containing protein [Clohesyomyces aquaticus]